MLVAPFICAERSVWTVIHASQNNQINHVGINPAGIFDTAFSTQQNINLSASTESLIMAAANPLNLVLKVKLMPAYGLGSQSLGLGSRFLGGSEIFTTSSLKQSKTFDEREAQVLPDFLDEFFPGLRTAMEPGASPVRFHCGYPDGYPENYDVPTSTPPEAQVLPQVSATEPII
jgi:hypothetical protein